MCQQRYPATPLGCECCSTTYLPPEEEIRMLEAMKTVEKIRLDAITQRIDVLRKMVKE